ncbi:MAG TPA: aldo/keto reductase [Segeticoccus sp.]|nr:aldo/keto reductase [Segeticoccus sp.]
MHYLDVAALGQVSRIGLGTWQFGSKEWGYGEEYAERTAGQVVRRALELGVTFFDTAELYGFGRSERILARALGPARDRVVVASKLFPLAPLPAMVHFRERASARRLQLDRIPLYQVHQPHPLVPDSVTMRGMRDLLREGRVGAVGVSNYSLDRWHKAELALEQAVVSNQVEFSLAHPDPLVDLVPFAQQQDRLVIAYSPLAQGLLAGRYDATNRPGGVRAANPLFSEENLRRAAALLDLLREVAAAHDARPAQVALAWLLALPRTVVIPGASSVEQLELNVAAAELVLTDDEQAALTAAARAFHPASAGRTALDAARQRLPGRRS